MNYFSRIGFQLMGDDNECSFVNMLIECVVCAGLSSIFDGFYGNGFLTRMKCNIY